MPRGQYNPRMVDARGVSSVAITPRGPVEALVRPPASKSLTLRAMAAAAMASGSSTLRGPLQADDTRLMADALGSLGIDLAWSDAALSVTGCGGKLPARGAALDLGDAGTPLRLLTALCATGRGRFVLDGSEQMRQRPISPLIEALRSLGVRARDIAGTGCPPVEIDADGFPGGSVTLDGETSSQFVSALLMAAPGGGADTLVRARGNLVSRPYVDLTIQMMARFGAVVEQAGEMAWRVDHAALYEARDVSIEADASSASYFMAAAAITGGRIRIGGIPPDSHQGDLVMLPLLSRMGCQVDRSEAEITVEGGPLRGLEADLSDAPDIVPTLAAVALYAAGPTRLHGVAHLRHKESDRLVSAAACVRALGGSAEVGPDSIAIIPPAAGRRGLTGALIDPANDHRLAMAFAVAGLGIPGVRISNPGCVAKSFPGFFDQLGKL